MDMMVDSHQHAGPTSSPTGGALCADGSGSLTALFFSEQLDDIAAAKAMCMECPVRAACLEGAVARREPWGVWGGELFFRGRILAQKRKRGRPAKARPTDDGLAMSRSA